MLQTTTPKPSLLTGAAQRGGMDQTVLLVEWIVKQQQLLKHQERLIKEQERQIEALHN